MHDTDELVRFYDSAYTRDPVEAELYSRWRALGAVGKADHVASLCGEAGLAPASVLEVGCGDGALLSELQRRGFCERPAGVEITASAVAIAGSRPGLGPVALYDGKHLPFAAGSFELGILSHVLEHVPDPAALLAELARVSAAVIVEVPLEANWSARRAGKREHASEVGHLQRLSRRDVHEIVAQAGLRVAAELEDPLPLRAHSFFAETPLQRARGAAKWGLRGSVHRLFPALARRAFTLHYACLCLPQAASRR
jgi:SAM-dependent methyltransferase